MRLTLTAGATATIVSLLIRSIGIPSSAASANDTYMMPHPPSLQLGWINQFDVTYKPDFDLTHEAARPQNEISMFDFPPDTHRVRFNSIEVYPVYRYLDELWDAEFPAVGIQSERVARRISDRPRKPLLSGYPWSVSLIDYFGWFSPDLHNVGSSPFYYFSTESSHGPLVLGDDTLEQVDSMQFGSISGNVTHRITGEPLRHAIVCLRGAPKGTTTDSTGKYTIRHLPPDTYTVCCIMGNYRYVISGRFVVSQGKNTVIDFCLAPTDNKLESLFSERKLAEISAATESQEYSAQNSAPIEQGMQLTSECDLPVELIKIPESGNEKRQAHYHSSCGGIISINSSSSEYGSISGVVVDSGDGTPLPSVAVQIVGATQGDLTSVDGEYFIGDVVAGNCSLIFRLVGYRTVQLDAITVAAGARTEVDIEMEATVLERDCILINRRDEVWIEKTHDCVIFH